MLPNTEARIQSLEEMDLIPGHTYLIHHNRERIRGNKPHHIREGILGNEVYTRFRGKFIRTISGDSIVLSRQDRSPVHTSDWHFALFENLEIVSRNKTLVPDYIYIIKPIPDTDLFTHKRVYDFQTLNNGRLSSYTDDQQKFLTEMINNNIVGFLTSDWNFAESLDPEKMYIDKTLGNLAYSRPNPNDSYEQQRLTDLQGRVLGEPLMGSKISGYLGTSVPDPTAEQLEQLTNIGKTGIGGRKRTRRNKRGKTRKGKSRKGKSRKSRRHYRK